MIPDFQEVYNELMGEVKSNSPLPPSRKEIISIIKEIQHLMFPEYFSGESGHSGLPLLDELYLRIKHQIEAAYRFIGNKNEDVAAITKDIIEAFPKIKNLLKKDIITLYSEICVKNSKSDAKGQFK